MKKLLGAFMLVTPFALQAMVKHTTPVHESLYDVYQNVAEQLTDLTKALRDVKDAIDSHPQEAQATLDTIINNVSERAKEYAIEIGVTPYKGAHTHARSAGTTVKK